MLAALADVAQLAAVGFGLETWVVMHEDLRASRRVAVVFDHLVASLTAYAGSRAATRHSAKRSSQ